jgi:hypothetical protein
LYFTLALTGSVSFWKNYSAQQPGSSRFEYVIHLLTDEPPDSFWNWKMLSTDDFTVLPLDKLAGATTHDKNWKAQNILFKSDNIAVREICRTPQFSLQLNIPGELSEAVNPAINSVAADLDRQFRSNELFFPGHRKAAREAAETGEGSRGAFRWT